MKTPGPDDFKGKSYQSRDTLILILNYSRVKRKGDTSLFILLNKHL